MLYKMRHFIVEKFRAKCHIAVKCSLIHSKIRSSAPFLHSTQLSVFNRLPKLRFALHSQQSFWHLTKIKNPAYSLRAHAQFC